MDDTAELLSISKSLENFISQATDEIFDTHLNQFLVEDISYIIPAVWGAKANEELDEIQKAIHIEVSKLVDESLQAFSANDLKDPQVFAIRYLINLVIIYTISYRIENTKNQISEKKIDADNLLMNLPISGNA